MWTKIEYNPPDATTIGIFVGVALLMVVIGVYDWYKKKGK